MGRVKLQLKKIENKTYRHITFAKRKSGLVKKAYELSTLCDIPVLLIIFSPAGKLILFDAKESLEETFKQFIALPEQHRGCLQNQELIHRVIAEMSVETNIFNLSVMSRDSKLSIESRLEEVKYQILKFSSELADVENQLRYYVSGPSCIKTLSEALYQEQVLEDTLRRLRIRKQLLESNGSIQPALKKSVYNMGNISDSMAANSNRRSSYPETNSTINIPGSGVFFSNQPQFYPGILHQQQPWAFFASVPSNSLNKLNDIDRYMLQPQLEQVANGNYTSIMINMATDDRQGTATNNENERKASDLAVGYCAQPFTF
ncbi:hypothetical protein K2173_002581 [Erythroxylum novogranatense]|uniref:MADS-box domain-containing protein n=1 Tax=Erythroxylum novogranatense TaxID=1862640 RepID=A0AAV8TQZ8_9ROSI|nr:hypothetical protein K2173_002581 [Erythroxylum novogranatense]